MPGMMQRLLAQRNPLFIGGVFLLLLGLGLALYLYLTPVEAVLFSGLDHDDAAKIAGQLEKLNIPYHVSTDGSTIRVQDTLVPQTRLKLFSSDLALKNGVGLEIFANNDFGMNEFSQNVNLMRALQGELTRTLNSIDGVKQARVHITLPSNSYNHARNQEAKVAIVLETDGQDISSNTVTGVQRLAAAAVPGVTLNSVVILDQKGRLLAGSLVDGDDSNNNTAYNQDRKSGIETDLETKARRLLNKALGNNSAEVAVNIELAYQTRQWRKEEPISYGQLAGLPTGVLQKSHQRTGDINDASPAPAPTTKSAKDKIDNEYEFASGRVVEQLDSNPGYIARINAGIIITTAISNQVHQALQQTLEQALGIDAKRGDRVTITVLPRVSADIVARTTAMASLTQTTIASAAPVRTTNITAKPQPLGGTQLLWLISAVFAVVVVIALLLGRSGSGKKRLSAQHREELLRELQQRLADYKA